MQITILKEDLQKAISIASRFVAARPTIPILSHLLLEAKSGQLRIASTNLEVGISISIGANVAQEGRTTVPAKAINDIVSSLPRAKIELELKEEMIHLTTGGYSITLASSPANDMPPIPDMVEGGIILKTDVFQKVAQKVSFVSGGEGRPEYSGILFLRKGENIEVVGTDGVRLSKVTVGGSLGEVDKILIPASVVSEMSKIFEAGVIKVLVDPEKSQILFGAENRVLTAQLLAYNFPDFEKIIPSGWQTRVTLEKRELLDAIQIASVVSQDYKVEFNISGGSLSLSSSNPQLGSQTSRLDAKIEGDDIIIAFNCKFVRDFLGSIGGDEVTIDLNSATSPGVFRDLQDEDFLHLIMPIRAQI